MTPPRNSNAARDIANVLHPYTDAKAHQEVGPVVISRGKGVRVWDDQGKEYIEALAGLWCASLGFDNERLVKAAADQMHKLPFYHSFTAKSHEPMIDLAEMLVERSPVSTDGKPMSWAPPRRSACRSASVAWRRARDAASRTASRRRAAADSAKLRCICATMSSASCAALRSAAASRSACVAASSSSSKENSLLRANMAIPRLFRTA